MVNRIEDLSTPLVNEYADIKYQCSHPKYTHHYLNIPPSQIMMDLCHECLTWVDWNEHHNHRRKTNWNYRHQNIVFYYRSKQIWDETHYTLKIRTQNGYDIFLMMRIRYHTSQEQLEAWMTHCPLYRWVEFHDVKLGVELSNKLRVVL